MKEKKLIEVSKRAKVSIWLHKEQYGFRTMADALDDYFKRTKEKVDNKHKKV